MLEINLLGRFKVQSGGEPVELPSRPAQMLLAYLSLQPGIRHRREKIAGRFWAESTESNARGNLRNALWKLRQAIGDEMFEADKSSLELSQRQAIHIDAAQLEIWPEEANRTEEWIQWAELYKGELLPGWYEEWVVRERERLEALFQRHMPVALEAMVEEQRWNAVLKWAEHWIALGHVPEPAYRALMTAHAVLGDSAAVAATYERCAEALRSELGVEPSPETKSHYEALAAGERPESSRAGQERKPPEAQHNLPAKTTTFIGREGEIDELTGLLAGSEHRLVTITGPGGSGKTHLALQVGRRLTGAFPDGVWFTDLSQLSDPDLIPSSIASVVDIKGQGDLSALEGLHEYLASREILLLLDNFEHLIEGAPIVGELLSSAEDLKCLVTSREPLRVYGERELPLRPLSLPEANGKPTLDTLEKSESVQLFHDRAAAIDPHFELTNDNADKVAEICRRLDGLPLAIELAAARVRMFPPKALLDQLDNRLATLTGGPRDAPARHRTLRNTLEWSHSLLSSNEQALFSRFGIFAGGCDLEALRAVCDDIRNDELLEGVRSLLAKSLLYQKEGPEGEPRYRMLETIREFALERLEGDGRLNEIARRHARQFADLAERAREELDEAVTERWIDRLEVEHDNVRTALRWSLDHDEDAALALRIVSSMATFWHVRGYLSEGYTATLNALESAGQDADSRLRAKATLGAALLAYRQNNIPAAGRHYEKALELSRQVKEPAWMAKALIGVGMVETERGQYDSVEEKYEQALELFRSVGDKNGMSNAFINLGWAAMRTGDYETAEIQIKKALDLSREVEHRQAVGLCLSGLGEAYLRMGELEQATEFLEESLSVRTSLGDKWGMGATLGSLGWAALRQEQWSDARARLKESLSLRKGLGDRGGMAWCLEKLAEIDLATGQEAEAAELYGAAHSIRERIGSSIDPADQAEYEVNLDRIRGTIGDDQFEDAWSAGAEQGVSITDQMDLPEPRAS